MYKLTEYNNIEIDGCHFGKDDIMSLIVLQMQLFLEEGLLFNIEECINIWQNYSNDLQASWLCFPDKAEDMTRYIRANDFFTNFIEYSK